MNDVRMREGNENKKRLKNMRNIRLRWKTFDTMRIMCERNSHLQQIKRRTSEVKEMLIRILDSQTINATGDRQRQEMRPFSYYYDKASHTFMVSSCSHAYISKIYRDQGTLNSSFVNLLTVDRILEKERKSKAHTQASFDFNSDFQFECYPVESN